MECLDKIKRHTEDLLKVAIEGQSDREIKAKRRDLFSEWYSPQFTKYRESIGRLSSVIPKESGLTTTDNNPVYNNYRNTLLAFARVCEYEDVTSGTFAEDVCMLKVNLELLSEHVQDMERVFSGQPLS